MSELCSLLSWSSTLVSELEVCLHLSLRFMRAQEYPICIANLRRLIQFGWDEISIPHWSFKIKALRTGLGFLYYCWFVRKCLQHVKSFQCRVSDLLNEPSEWATAVFGAVDVTLLSGAYLESVPVQTRLNRGTALASGSFYLFKKLELCWETPVACEQSTPCWTFCSTATPVEPAPRL